MHIHFYTFTGNPDGTNHIRGIEYKYVLEERYTLYLKSQSEMRIKSKHTFDFVSLAMASISSAISSDESLI